MDINVAMISIIKEMLVKGNLCQQQWYKYLKTVFYTNTLWHISKQTVKWLNNK